MSQKHLVYSTDQGRICPHCQNPIASCQCHQQDALIGSGNVKVSLETKGRKGKGVTLITDLAMTADELKTLSKELKSKCSTGGAIKAGVIEIQGDQRTLIMQILLSKGIKAKKAGG